MINQVLFLCTGNSARSQIAEGLVNYFLGETWHASSAGVAPTGRVHPLAREVLEEIGVATAGLRSKSVTEFRDTSFDLVITLCDHAATHCPAWLGAGEVVHIGFPDPAAVRGDAEEDRATFRRVRDAILREVVGFVSRWQAPPPSETPRPHTFQLQPPENDHGH